MLDRVKKLNGVGPILKLHRPAATPFSSFTVIVGNNSHGKSTFAQCMRAASLFDVQAILARSHIDGSASVPPEIELLWIIDGKKTASTTFQKDKWNMGCPYPIYVFDRQFVDDNVFLGDHIDRTNREKLTELVLGQNSVGLAKQLEQTKREEKDTTRRHKELGDGLSELVRDLGYTASDLVKVNPETIPDDVENQIERLESEIQRLNAVDSNRDLILGFRPPETVAPEQYPIDTLNRLMAALATSLEDITHSVRARIDRHIGMSIGENKSGTEKWLADGFQFISERATDDEPCPFCGQDLSSVQDLIDSYSAVFSEEFRKHETWVTAEMNVALDEMKALILRLRKGTPDLDISSLVQFGKVAKQDVTEFQREGETCLRCVRQVAQELDEVFVEATEVIRRLKESKTAMPHTAVTAPDFSSLEEAWNSYLDKITDFNTWVKRVTQFADGVKENTRSTDVDEAIRTTTSLLRSLRLRDRYQKNISTIGKYIKAQENVSALAQKAKVLRTDLQASRTVFVKDYLQRVQRYFSHLGSNEFTLHPDSDFRGDKDLLGFSMRFRDKIIDARALSITMSESDKRALAFAIFAAHLDSLPQDEQRKAIVVLDDPVVSFDQERIHNAATVISNMAHAAAQVILLTHFEPLSRYVHDKHSLFNDTTFLRLSKDKKGSTFERFDPAAKFVSDHERRLRRIKSFLDRDHDEDVSKDVREFLYDELRFRYWQHINEMEREPQGFGELIGALLAEGAINERLHRDLDRFRDQLNGDVHGPVTDDREALRQLAGSIWGFVFSELVPSV